MNIYKKFFLSGIVAAFLLHGVVFLVVTFYVKSKRNEVGNNPTKILQAYVVLPKVGLPPLPPHPSPLPQQKALGERGIEGPLLSNEGKLHISHQTRQKEETKASLHPQLKTEQEKVNTSFTSTEKSKPVKEMSSTQIKGEHNILLELLHNAIAKHQQSLNAAFILPPKGKVIVGFMLSPHGEVYDMRVVATSNDKELDNAAKKSVAGIAPFEPAVTYLHHPKYFSVAIIYE